MDGMKPPPTPREEQRGPSPSTDTKCACGHGSADHHPFGECLAVGCACGDLDLPTWTLAEVEAAWRSADAPLRKLGADGRYPHWTDLRRALLSSRVPQKGG